MWDAKHDVVSLVQLIWCQKINYPKITFKIQKNKKKKKKKKKKHLSWLDIFPKITDGSETG